MTRTIKLETFFEDACTDDRSSEPNQYVAGFKDEDGEPWGVLVPLSADDVDLLVLK